MKKLLLVLAFVTMSFVSNAQLFVAGSISAKYSSGETRYDKPFTTVDNDPTEKGFAITPAVGYMIPGKSYGFGLSLGYAYTSTSDNDYYQEHNGDVIVELCRNTYTNAFDIAPFFRYAYAKFEKITLYADLKIPVGFSNTKEDFDDKTSVLDNGFVLGVRLIPGLTYKFNNHILFTTEIGLLSINYLHTRNTKANNDVKIDDDFTIGANNRTVASFGFVYLF